MKLIAHGHTGGLRVHVTGVARFRPFDSFRVLGLQRRRLIPALTLDSAPSSPSHRSSKQAITSSSSSSSSPGACWVDGPLGPPAPSNLRGAAATSETFEIKVYEIDDVERLQKRRDKAGNKVRKMVMDGARKNAYQEEKEWMCGAEQSWREEKGAQRAEALLLSLSMKLI